MININLMPLNMKKREFPWYKIYGFITLIVLLIFFIYSIFVFGSNYLINQELEEGKNDLLKINTWEKRYNDSERQERLIKKDKAIIKSIEKSKVYWGDSLIKISNVCPNGCWLTNFQQDSKEDNIIKLSGKALTMEDLLEFVHNLQKQPYIQSVNLSNVDANISEKTYGEVDYAKVKFDIVLKQRGE